jgi:EpsI family protein
VLVDKEDDTWRSIAEIPRLFDHGLSKWEIEQTTVVGNSHRLLVWRWFRVGSRYTSNSYYAKLLQLWSNLIENRVDASVIVIATPYQDRIEEASSILDSFTRSVIQKMESSIDTLVGLDGVKN